MWLTCEHAVNRYGDGYLSWNNMDTIPLINNDLMDALVRTYVQQFHALIPADLADADINRLRTRLEVRL